MPVFLVRHAHAGSRSEWDGLDSERPLTSKGRLQAEALIGMIDGSDISVVLSSPYLRCVQTLEPLAAKYGLSVNIDDCLGEGGGSVAAALSLVRSLAGTNAAVCTHGDVIPEILVALADEDRVDLGPHPRQAKGSVWVLEGVDGSFKKARYIAPHD